MDGGFSAFFKQQATQTTKVIQRAAAALQVLFQLFQFVMNQSQRFQPPVRLSVLRSSQISGHLCSRVSDGFQQQPDIVLCILDTVKRCLGLASHGEAFLAGKWWRRGWDLNPRYPLRYVRFRGGSFQPLTHLSVTVVSGWWSVASDPSNCFLDPL